MTDPSGVPDNAEVASPPSGGGRLRRLLTRLPALVGLVLLIVAGLVIWRELQHLSLQQVMGGLHAIPTSALWKGAGATLLSYAILSFYDGLACLHVKAGVSWGRAAFVAFCSYVLSHNLGCAAISGTAVRYRLYRNWGVPGLKIASIVAFCSVTYWLGMLGLVGFILLDQPGIIPYVRHVPHWMTTIGGGGCFAVLLAYVLLPCWKQEVRIYKWTLRFPDWRIGLGQIFSSMADMSATALIAWCVLDTLPQGSSLTFGGFLAIYIGAYTAGLLANVPGGLGVFDSTMLLALSPWFSVPHIMASILVFRLFYYIIPLLLAGAMFAGHELFIKGAPLLARFGKTVEHSQSLRSSEADFSTVVATGSQAILGIVIVVYALLAPLPQFHSFWGAVILQGAAFLLTLIGVMLVGLSLGLSQRVALAWRLSVGALYATLAILAVRQAHWVAFVVVLAVLLVLLPFRKNYYRQAYWRVEPFSPFILAPFSLWLCGLAGVSWIARQRHLGHVWWRSMVYDAHTAVGRWFLGGAALCCVVGLWLALRKTRIHILPWNMDTRVRYACLQESDFALSLPLERLFVPDGMLTDATGKAACAVLRLKPFLLSEPVLLCLGGAVGARGWRGGAIWRLRDYAVQEGCQLAVLQYGARQADIYASFGLGLFSLESDEGWFLVCRPEDYHALKLLLGV